MDIALPGMGGIEAVGEIMSSRPLPILVLSGQVGPGTNLAAAAWLPGRSTCWRRTISTCSTRLARRGPRSGTG